MRFRDELITLDACSPAVDWVGERDLKTAWLECERADWMLWWSEYKTEIKNLVFLSAKCAETVLHIYEEKYPDDMRVRDCIQACFDFAKGKITEDELKKYRDRANAAAADAAAFAAACAVYAADARAARAARAANAANAAVNAANAADDDDTCTEHHIKMCNIIREHINEKGEMLK